MHNLGKSLILGSTLTLGLGLLPVLSWAQSQKASIGVVVKEDDAIRTSKLKLEEVAEPEGKNASVAPQASRKRAASQFTRIVITAVAPQSPAYVAGLREGDAVIAINGTRVSNRDHMRSLVTSLKPGNYVTLTVERGARTLQIRMQLSAQSSSKSGANSSAAQKLGENRLLQPISVSSGIRRQIAAQALIVRLQLDKLPEGTDAQAILGAMQKIKDLARQTNKSKKGWMSGQQGAATLQFKDDEGMLILQGVGNELTLEVYNLDGKRIYTSLINSAAQRKTLPASIIIRLKAL